MPDMRFLRLFPLLFSFILLISPHMSAQSKSSIDAPLLHGKYKPYGHFGRHYVFYNTGEFTSTKPGNDSQPEIKAAGSFILEKKRLILNFIALPTPESGEVVTEPAHQEVHQFRLEADNGFEISQFRIDVKGPKKNDPRWVREDIDVPYKLKKSENQE